MTPLEASVRVHHNRPQLFVSGQPVVPVFYSLTDSPAGRWTWEEIPNWNLQKFAEIGVRLFGVSIWLEWIWDRAGHVDVTLARRQIRGVLDVCPEAGVMIRLHVNSPPWWNEENPDELVRYADGPVEPIQLWGLARPLEGDLQRTPRHSMASRKWRDDAGAAVQQFCRALAATPEGDRLIALHLAAGVFHEWHYYGFIDHEPDTGAAMTNYFRRWLRERYQTDAALRAAWNDASVALDGAEVPGLVARRHTSDGCFRDPARERCVIDYFECHQLAVQESAEHFCRVAKEHWPRPLVTGIFYGYFFTLFGRMVTGGHLQAQRLLESPWVDFLAAPQSYRHRDAGQTGISRGLLESVRLHGKLWLDEYDTQPGLGAQKDADPVRELANSLGIERRCLIEPLIRGHGLWFYDFGLRAGRGWWDHPALLAQAKQLKELFEQRLAQSCDSAADVLLVMDTDVFYYLGNSRETDPVTPVAIDDATEALLHAGAAVDMVYLFDLERVNLDRYRAIVLPNAYLLTERQRRFVSEKVARNGRHLLWTYAPGYTDGQRLEVRFIAEATGIEVERVENELPARVTVTNLGLGHVEFGFGERRVRPLFAVNDRDAEPLGQLAGSPRIGLARKTLADSTAWFSSVPLTNTDVMRSILREAGAHIHQDAGDVTYAGSGMVCLHSLTGGDRTIALRNGTKTSLTLAPKSTVLLDSCTGQKLLEEPVLSLPRLARE